MLQGLSSGVFCLTLFSVTVVNTRIATEMEKSEGKDTAEDTRKELAVKVSGTSLHLASKCHIYIVNNKQMLRLIGALCL